MAEIIVFNGVTYFIPDVGETDWGQHVTDYLVALAGGTLQKTGGPFTLTADASFGPTFGLVAPYLKSQSNNISTTGIVRLATADTIAFRNFANTGNNLLGVNAADQLTYNGVALEFNSLPSGDIFVGNVSNVATAVPMTGDIGITNTGVTSIQSGVITNVDINASAAIAYTKLNLTGSITNTDIYSGAAIAYSKLALTGSVINNDIASGASIAYSKLAPLTASKVLVSDGSGIVSTSTTTTTTLGYLDATSSIQTQLNSKQATLTIGDLTDVGTDGITVTGGTGAVIGTGTSLSQHVADSSHNGYLSSTDWSTFNNKQATIATGNLTAAGIDGITVTGGTGAVIGSGTSFAQHVADVSHNGYLSSTDWATFNGKLAAWSGLTQYGVMYASTTSTVVSTAAGTTGQFLGANTGAAPTWQSPSGSGTVNSGTQYQLAYYATSTTAVSGLTLITASRALVSDANGLPVASATTATELGYVSGVTSAIQTQINAKQATLTAGQLPGTPTNDDATAGNVGEYVESFANGVSYGTSGAFSDATSIALTAGDWDITVNGMCSPAAVNVTATSGGISTTSGNSAAGLVNGRNYINGNYVNTASGDNLNWCIANYRVSHTGTITYYLKIQAAYGVGAVPSFFGTISARRRR